jgi:hypothetical protein
MHQAVLIGLRIDGDKDGNEQDQHEAAEHRHR